jgi:hypothetical protein
MINLNPATLPPSPVPADNFDRFLTFIAFLSDPDACRARISEIIKEAEKAGEVIFDAAKVKAELAAERAALAAEREKQTKQLAEERADFEKRCAGRDQEINARSPAVDKLQAATKGHHEKAAALSADLQGRVERIKAAAAAVA